MCCGIQIGKKKPPRGELTAREKQTNRKLARIRVQVEHDLAGVKRSRIVKDVLRNTDRKKKATPRGTHGQREANQPKTGSYPGASGARSRRGETQPDCERCAAEYRSEKKSHPEGNSRPERSKPTENWLVSGCKWSTISPG